MVLWTKVSIRITSGPVGRLPNPGSLFKYQIPPFQAAVDAGTSGIMPYYCNPSNEKSGAQIPKDWWQSDKKQFEEVASAYNKTILTKLLRERMGFTGVINTDSGILGNNAFGVQDLTLPQRFAKAVKAGVNIFSDNNSPQGLIDAVNQHLLRSPNSILRSRICSKRYSNSGCSRIPTRIQKRPRRSPIQPHPPREPTKRTGSRSCSCATIKSSCDHERKEDLRGIFAEPAAGGRGGFGGQRATAPQGTARGDRGARDKLRPDRVEAQRDVRERRQGAVQVNPAGKRIARGKPPR